MKEAGQKRGLYYAAATTTAIAGILHFSLVHPLQGSLQNIGVFFLVAGIGGTIVLIAMYVITRMPDNPITGRGAPTNAIGIKLKPSK
jgi:hypothetical protein